MKTLFILLIIFIATMSYGEEKCTETENGSVRMMEARFDGSPIYTVEQCMCAMAIGDGCPFRWIEVMSYPTTDYNKALKAYREARQKNNIIKKREAISKLKWKQVKP